MDENKKEYSIVGKVEIGTDEYRDLIEGIISAKKDSERANSERWEYYRKSESLEKQLDSYKKQVKEFQDFLNSDEEVRNKFRNYRFEQLDDRED